MRTPAPSPTASHQRGGRSTRDAIIEVASRLIQVRGYNNTSLDDVLRESGVGKGNFYYHFKSKEELGYAILDQAIAGFLERTLDPCFSAADGEPFAQIRCFLDRVLQTQRDRNCIGGCPLGNLASELSDVHEGFRTRLAGVFSAWRERLTLALAEARDDHAGGDWSPEAVAHFIVAALEGAILMTKVSKDITVMERCVTELGRYLSLFERPA